MIRISNVSYAIAGTTILEDIDLAIPSGGVTALIGPNGAGKSTLLSLIARLLPLSSGTITLDGLPVDRTPTRALALRLAVMAQEGSVASRLRVEELVGFGRFPHHRGRPRAQDQAAVAEALALFDLEALADRFVDTLSGGQRQRARVAMAYCQGTDYLLLDEPLNSLDIIYARALMRTLRRIADDRGRTIVVVLHDLNHAAAHADRIVALREGRLVADGPTGEVMTTATLQRVFGDTIPVAEVDGHRIALHFV
ncbi:iron ABC transporter ATP-binding protein [Acuticoccus mangrovi]|uniref:ATP-binding cassette domain-containing protein n=1 Tax=Acuticoccus mangrovi TaxID=2796142 RepID=A0A934MP45_9HYPH|nr:ATP-binding cassette domain-containing protein [Acuticoccus mangrovi]MBJ3778769.1 ATP-binding cassette domain-containing protein [Acuticoccus mangrovi]